MSVAPRAVKHVVPGGSVSPSAAVVAQHEAAAAGQSSEALEELWEMSVEDGALSLALEEVSELLVGESSTTANYATYCALRSQVGKTFFKGSKDGQSYQPRPAAESLAIQEQLRAEAAAQAADEAFRARVLEAAQSGSPFDLGTEDEEVRDLNLQPDANC